MVLRVLRARKTDITIFATKGNKISCFQHRRCHEVTQITMEKGRYFYFMLLTNRYSDMLGVLPFKRNLRFQMFEKLSEMIQHYKVKNLMLFCSISRHGKHKKCIEKYKNPYVRGGSNRGYFSFSFFRIFILSCINIPLLFKLK